VVYNAFNKPVSITRSGASVAFAYGAEGNRIVQSATASGSTSRTVYLGLGETGKSLYERTTRGSEIEHVQFIYAGNSHGGNAFAVRVANQGQAPTLKYNHFDHLGSVTAVSNATGRVADSAWSDPQAGLMGYDSWGARRNPEGTDATPESSFAEPAGRRGFTSHETIPGVGLINMNGRVYDPVEAGEALAGPSHRRGYVGFDGDVGPLKLHRRAEVGRGLAPRLLVHVHDEHVGPGRGEHPRSRSPQAGSPAGDQERLAGDQHA